MNINLNVDCTKVYNTCVTLQIMGIVFSSALVQAAADLIPPSSTAQPVVSPPLVDRFDEAPA